MWSSGQRFYDALRAGFLEGRARTYGIALAIFALTLWLYWPVSTFDFVYYDDPEYVFQNPDVKQGLTAWGLVWSFVDAHAANWHPLTWLSHMLDCEVFGLHSGWHHLVNAILHSINSTLLFLFVRYVTSTNWHSLIVALLFTCHPLRVESVAWVSERKDVLSGLFFLLTLWAYAAYSKRCRPTTTEQPGGRAGDRFYWLSLSFFTLGLLSKPMLVTVPAVLLLLDFWPLKRMEPGGGVASLWPLLRDKIPYGLLSLAFSLITLWAQSAGNAVIPLGSLSMLQRLQVSAVGCFTYLQKTVWPENLSVLYLRPETLPVLDSVVAALCLLLITIVVLYRWKRNPYLLVGWGWFLIMLAPVCGLVQVGLHLVADRYTYLPGIGLAMVAAWTIAALLEQFRQRFYIKTAVVVCMAGLIALLTAQTREQIYVWRNTETLMGQALRVNPSNYVAHVNLGVYYTSLGDHERARTHRELYTRYSPETGKGIETGPEAESGKGAPPAQARQTPAASMQPTSGS